MNHQTPRRSNADLPTDSLPPVRPSGPPHAHRGEYDQHPSQGRHRIAESGPHAAPGWHPVGPAPRNGLGTAALILGIVGVLAGLIPLTFWLAGILAVLAVVLGVTGVARANRGQASNKRTALAGTLLGGLAAALAVLGAVLLGQAADQLATDLDQLGRDLDTPALSESDMSPAAPLNLPDSAFVAVEPPAAPVPSSDGRIAAGTWLVGDDVEPGTYRTPGANPDEPSGMCYWSRLSGLSGELDDVITNGLPDGPAVVTIAPGDAAFQTRGCQPWERQ